VLQLAELLGNLTVEWEILLTLSTDVSLGHAITSAGVKAHDANQH